MDSIPPSSGSSPVQISSFQTSAGEAPGEAAEDPFSPSPQPVAYFLGALIALTTVTVPLLTVVSGRSYAPIPQAMSESSPSGAIPAAWAREARGPAPKQELDQR